MPKHSSAFPFVSEERADLAANIGLWVFLATEVLFFGPWFTGYTVYRLLHGPEFHEASRLTHIGLGTLNTALLLTSSLTFALAVQSARAGLARARIWLSATALLGIAFLVVKGIEYTAEYHDGLVPALHFTYQPANLEATRGVELFFYFYFGMTGIHALHLTIGVGLVLWLVLRAPALPRPALTIDLVALYWHFVDIVWVFLFPMIYLVGRAG